MNALPTHDQGVGENRITVTTRFGLGDVVFYLRHELVARHAACGACSGTGAILLPQTQRGYVGCPDCGGYAHQGPLIDTVDAYDITGPLTVGEVRVVVNNDGALTESYMCVETGVGSGTVYKSDRLFVSLDAAEEWATAAGWMHRPDAIAEVRD